MAVKDLMEDLGYTDLNISLGEVTFNKDMLSGYESEVLQKRLKSLGFELIDDRRSCLVEKIKKHIIEYVDTSESISKNKISDYLSSKINYDYTYMSNVFSTKKGTTIEQYVINIKIEKSKELLIFDDLSLTEISHRLGYSSLAHLSTQFKRVTGMTPTKFKKIRDANKRFSIDKL